MEKSYELREILSRDVINQDLQIEGKLWAWKESYTNQDSIPNFVNVFIVKKPREIKELIEDLQTGGEKHWGTLYYDFPESMKGECAKHLWDNENFCYGAEYGALIILNHLSQDFIVSVKQSKEEKE